MISPWWIPVCLAVGFLFVHIIAKHEIKDFTWWD